MYFSFLLGLSNVRKLKSIKLKNNYFFFKPTMVQICRLENIEHKSMKQVSYSDEYSLSAGRDHHSHLQFSFVVGDAFCPHF